jgi:hypothetical protein
MSVANGKAVVCSLGRRVRMLRLYDGADFADQQIFNT